ncbi:MAG: preprotein translocase subunit SecE [Candidatus Omnitrophica bacterium]|nr:preprotein translocase subunit SecE [Candidatus Omnitrophota bacterium]
MLGVQIPPGLPISPKAKLVPSQSTIQLDVARGLKKLYKVITEVKVEMQKVSWSTKDELIGSTTVVIVSTLLLAMFIGMVDIVLSRFIGLILK